MKAGQLNPTLLKDASLRSTQYITGRKLTLGRPGDADAIEEVIGECLVSVGLPMRGGETQVAIQSLAVDGENLLVVHLREDLHEVSFGNLRRLVLVGFAVQILTMDE